jgi:hypothetical protein
LPTDEELEILSRKLTSLKLAYDQYFLGSRPREPAMLAEEVRKLVVVYSNQAIKNTAMRFKFNSIVSRYQAFRRQWTDTLRKIEAGTYSRHQFKAKLHERPEQQAEPVAPRPAQDRNEIYEAFVEARQACGQSVADLTASKLDRLLDKQERELRKRFGDSQVRFKVVVENGRAKLTASRRG